MVYDPSYSSADMSPGTPLDPSEMAAHNIPQATQHYDGDILPTASPLASSLQAGGVPANIPSPKKKSFKRK